MTTTAPSTLKDKINCSTPVLILLNFATAGIYLVLWLSRHYKTIDEVTGHKTANDTYITWMAVCLGLYGAFASDPTDETLLAIAGLLLIAYLVLAIVWSFKARTALQDYASRLGVEYSPNAILTFIGNVFFINYCINKLATLPQPGHPTTVSAANNDPSATPST